MEMTFMEDVWQLMQASHFRLLSKEDWETAQEEQFTVSPHHLSSTAYRPHRCPLCVHAKLVQCCKGEQQYTVSLIISPPLRMGPNGPTNTPALQITLSCMPCKRDICDHFPACHMVVLERCSRVG